MNLLGQSQIYQNPRMAVKVREQSKSNAFLLIQAQKTFQNRLLRRLYPQHKSRL